MVRTRSGLGNDNGPWCGVIEHAPEAVLVVEPFTTSRVQAMMRSIMAEQREEMRRLLHDIGREPTTPVVQLNLNKEQSEEGNYNWTVSQAETRLVWRTNPDRRAGQDGCKYKDFKGSNPPSLSGSRTPIEFRTGSPRWKWYLRVANVTTDRRPS